MIAFILTSQIFSLIYSLRWTVETNPVVFGYSVALRCSVTVASCLDNYVRRWHGGPRQSLFCLNYKSNDPGKYRMSTINSKQSFDLSIDNFEESDIECNYTCSCGFEVFTSKLQLHNYDYIYPLYYWKIKHTIVLKNQLLSVNLWIEKVYPLPECRMLLNSIASVSHMTFKENYKKDQILPSVTIFKNFIVDMSICNAFLKVECWDEINSSYSPVLQEKLNTSRSCNDISHSHNLSSLELYIILPVGAVIMLLISIGCRTLRNGILQTRNCRQIPVSQVETTEVEYHIKRTITDLDSTTQL